MRKLFLILLVLLFTTGLAAAGPLPQPDGTPQPGTWTYTELITESTCFDTTTTTTLEDRADDDSLEPFFMLLPVLAEDGLPGIEDDALLLIFPGDDIVLTRTAPGEYSGVLLDPLPDVDYASVVTVVDSEHMISEATMQVGPCSLALSASYERVGDVSAFIWTETPREFDNLSFFGDCFGRDAVAEPPDAWAQADMLVPLAYDSEADTYALGRKTFALDEGGYVFEVEKDTEVVVTLSRTTLTPLSDSVIGVDVFYQLNGSDNCIVHYTSQYVNTEWEGWADYVDELMPAEDAGAGDGSESP